MNLSKIGTDTQNGILDLPEDRYYVRCGRMWVLEEWLCDWIRKRLKFPISRLRLQLGQRISTTTTLSHSHSKFTYTIISIIIATI